MAEIIAEALPKIQIPTSVPAQEPDEFAKGQTTVTMHFPKPVLLTADNGAKVKYPIGVHEVPAHVADHWYLRVNSAVRYAKPVPVGELAKEAVKTGKQK